MTDNIVERVARIIDPAAWSTTSVELPAWLEGEKNVARAKARAAIAALREPSEAMWGGLARAIMMWLDFGDRKTPAALFQHLERSGHTIPDWLRDEPEMKCLDHVPSKGTRCVIIWRAMLEDALDASLSTEGNEG